MKTPLILITAYTVLTVTSLLVTMHAATAQTIDTGDIDNQFETCIDVNDNTTIIGDGFPLPSGQSYCSPSPSATATPTATPTPTPTPSPTISPTPTPSTSPTPTPSSTPTPTPSTTPTATPTPTPTPGVGGPSKGKTSALGYDTGCPTPDVYFTFDAKQDGDPAKDVKVVFTYNGESRDAWTNEDGRASVTLRRAGNEQTVYANADGDYPDQSTVVKIPDCPAATATPSPAAGVGGRSGGQVLGAAKPATFAATGTGLNASQFTALLGTLLSGIGYVLKRRE